jgi:hypothetical protein
MRKRKTILCENKRILRKKEAKTSKRTSETHAKRMSPISGEGGSGGCGVTANEYSCAHGSQINFKDLTPYLTYDWCRTVKTVKRQNRFLGIENCRIKSSWLKTNSTILTILNILNIPKNPEIQKNSQTSKTSKNVSYFKILPTRGGGKKGAH